MQRYLLFATELYALPILRPLACAIEVSGGQVAWSVAAPLVAYLTPDERCLLSAQEVSDFAPRAVFSASNWVPDFFPGVKVQVFHGFNVEKRADGRGHFRIRNLFDLYCTQGPATTQPFLALAAEHRHFAVVETGWPKLDPLFDPDGAATRNLRPHDGRVVCMYAATFTESLSSARALYEQIAAQVASGERYWLLTLHPKCDPQLMQQYRALAGSNARYLEAVDLVPMMRAADVLVSDTSSVVSEFAVQAKPVITFRNRAPKPHMLDISDPFALEATLQRALTPTPELLAALRDYATLIHPLRDGQSSERVLAATEALIHGELGTLARKPLNLWRKLQGRMRYRRWLRGLKTD